MCISLLQILIQEIKICLFPLEEIRGGVQWVSEGYFELAVVARVILAHFCILICY